ncbi:hypothetical protein J6TS7_42510 [Paenibacillus dendritiformis]|nr:hypothetical protein J6TS7_42510 [Paenibacillus dendritiformis]
MAAAINRTRRSSPCNHAAAFARRRRYRIAAHGLNTFPIPRRDINVLRYRQVSWLEAEYLGGLPGTFVPVDIEKAALYRAPVLPGTCPGTKMSDVPEALLTVAGPRRIRTVFPIKPGPDAHRFVEPQHLYRSICCCTYANILQHIGEVNRL